MSVLHFLLLLATVAGFGLGYGTHALLTEWLRRPREGGDIDLVGARPTVVQPRPRLTLVAGEGRGRPGERFRGGAGFYSAAWLDDREGDSR